MKFEEEFKMFGFLKRNDGKVINVNDIDNLIGKVELIFWKWLKWLSHRGGKNIRL